ncbi:MAG: class D beta-lactamase [Bacteroidetes bacterium]|nr:class D beta-lactamase [Bacteroidota bacterium]MBS1649141.1 class D beta-lactamase [Bacteroidota bacterium]
MKLRTVSCFILFISFLILHSCSPNNVTIDNSLQKYFDSNHVTGTFALFDNGSGQFTVYNLPRYKDSAFLPASTFKIVNSLIGLQIGKITNEKMIIKWDGVKRWNEAWNKDLTMEEAFKLSAVPYYQEVARRIGKDTMQFWLDSLHYGNKKIGGAIDSFWLNNSLKVTADEQLGLVKRLYFDQLPFDKRTQSIVKKIMLQENNANYSLSYKTGFGYKEDGKSLAWIVGWVEENKHPYFFALNIEGAHDADLVNMRMTILKGILKQLDFLQGKR